jgi:hypothetical protein
MARTISVSALQMSFVKGDMATNIARVPERVR